MNIIENYKLKICERFTDLITSGKTEYDNNDLWKIFEWFSCIKLSEKYGKIFYEYDDIHPEFKEKNKMSRYDTGIDLCDLENSIVQCKLRKNTLTWNDCSTFFGSVIVFDDILKKPVVRWENLIITRNDECKISYNLANKMDLFTDVTFSHHEIITFCKQLMINPPNFPAIVDNFKLRDYQLECIKLIVESKQNVIINLPTGTGKNMVIIHSMQKDKKYLILVPRIILMEQLRDEIIKHKPEFKKNIQLIGDSNNVVGDKNITICVFNSVKLVEEYAHQYDKIFIDEAHHIKKPEIYEDDEILDDVNEDIVNEKYDEEYDEEEEYDEYDDEYYDDDANDELKGVRTYVHIISDFAKYSNNVYLSATIDEMDGFLYYKKDIRDMIERGYLSDYTITVPIFSDDPTNKNICEYLIRNYRSVIIYCNTQKEGMEINRLMNSIMDKCSEYVDCKTAKRRRGIIIDRYKRGELSFIVNVRILVEGFDAPITRGVCFMHLPSNGTTVVQVIGRTLRLYPGKTVANIILPCSKREDGGSIEKFLRIIAKNDSRMRLSFNSKSIGGYIAIDKIIEGEGDGAEEINMEFKFDVIYKSLGGLLNSKERWELKLSLVKEYIDAHGRRPYELDPNIIIARHGRWINTQLNNFKNKEQIMKNDDIYIKWDEFVKDNKYKKFFRSKIEIWNDTLDEVIKYIDVNKKRPTIKTAKNKKNQGTVDHNKSHKTRNKTDNNSRLCGWITIQLGNFKRKTYIMENEYIYNKWKEFMENDKYNKYFKCGIKQWYDTLDNVKKYIDDNKKRPCACNNDKNNKKDNVNKNNEEDKHKNAGFLGKWIDHQLQNFKNRKFIMKNDEIYNKWNEFINDANYKKYLMTNEEIWYSKFDEVKKYIDKYDMRPSLRNEDEEIAQLNVWISKQQQNFKKKDRIMKNEEIYQLWKNFIETNKYRKHIIWGKELWLYHHNEVKMYFDRHGKYPSRYDAETKQLNIWLCTQRHNYKNMKEIMKNEDIRTKWEEFVNEYPTFFE